MRDESAPIHLVGHTGLIYFWPVWATGFVLSALSWADARGVGHYGAAWATLLVAVITASNVPMRGLWSVVAKEHEEEVENEELKIKQYKNS